ncbi:MAG TPA: M1 family aminopeptidase [Candidatus Desulfaltia sp.]|nr:M1 family aminopeptidase [Candidatus Desulfaltia sp.]
MKKPRSFLRAALLLLLLLIPGATSADQGIPEFILQLQNDLSSCRFDSYLDAYAPELRDAQRKELSRYFDFLKMETVTMTWANKRNVDPAEPTIFLQVVYQNASAVLIETWQLLLENSDGRWRIKEKSVRGNISRLYKIRLPAERIERASRVEISHTDINLTFHDALVFYDNIPDLETALLIIGDGRLTFSPSNVNEKHQLELLYKNKVLEDRIDHAFLHFSSAFFNQNVKINGNIEILPSSVSEDEMSRAASIFEKYRSRHFTIQTAFSPEPLSFLPQREDAAIYFQGRKRGDLSYVYSSFAEEEVSLYEFSRERFISLYSPGADEGRSRLVITFGQKYDIQHYEIELDFEPRSLHLSAKARITLLSQAGRLEAVKFKLHPELEILRIYDAERRELFFTQDPAGSVFYVYFLEPIGQDAKATLEVLYRGRLEPPAQVTDTVVALQKEINPIPFRYDTYLFSQSAQWYPAPLVEDYFTARLKIIVPPDYSSVANGQLLEQGILNGIQKVTEIDKIGSSFSVFEAKSPLKHLSFLVGKLSLTREKGGDPPLASYCESLVRSAKKDFLDEAGQILEFYESRFGPFPFENLRIIQRLWMTAGGHSPASFIVLNELPRVSRVDSGIRSRLIGNPDSPVDLSSKWKEYFIAHEIAHQWWGQGVTAARYRDQWLSEGLAQYAAVLYIRAKYGESALADILKRFSRWTKKKSKWGPITMGSRLSFTDFEAYQAIVYDKTALVLNMLRDLLGDEVFFTGLKEFFAAHKYSAAATGQFRRMMEKVSGRDLNDFFRLWFDSHVLPETRVSTSVVKREAGSFLKVRVNQLVDTFVFPLWIAWEDESGALRREKLVVDKKSQEFELPLAGPARKIAVNPDMAVPGNFRVS